MRRLSRSAATSSRRLLVLASVGAVCTLGLISRPRSRPVRRRPTGRPERPSNANDSITLTWTPSPGATSYNVYRGTTSGGEGTTPIATTTGTTYTDSEPEPPRRSTSTRSPR